MYIKVSSEINRLTKNTDTDLVSDTDPFTPWH